MKMITVTIIKVIKTIIITVMEKAGAEVEVARGAFIKTHLKGNFTKKNYLHLQLERHNILYIFLS